MYILQIYQELNYVVEQYELTFSTHLLTPGPERSERGEGGGAFFVLDLRLLGGVGLLFINSENAFFGFCGEVGELCLGDWEVGEDEVELGDSSCGRTVD